jgi:predicted RNA binding protein YcfA (HicA-like mRNA interferase family)
MKDLKFICTSEEWRGVPEFDGYQVSSFGRVRGVDRLRNSKHGLRLIRGKELKQVLNKKGYPEVRLRKNGSHTRLVHKLVASAFLTKPEHCTQINHVNGIKTDNRVTNLQWVTQSENQLHAYKLGLQPNRSGEGNGRATLTDEKVTALKELYNSGKSTKEVAEIMNISIYIVRAIIAGKSWKFNVTDILRRDERRKPIVTI